MTRALSAPNPPLDPHLFLRPRPPCYSKLRCDLQAFTLPEFRDPLLVAVVLLVVGIAAVLVWRGVVDRRLRRRRDQQTLELVPPVAGLLVVAAALVGYQRTGHLVHGLAEAVLVLAGGGLLADAFRLGVIWRMVLAVPGGLLLADRSGLPDPRWACLLAGATAVVGAGSIASFDRRLGRLGLGPVLLAVTCFGLYENVPDPDFALLLVGAALPLALLGWPLVLARLGGAGAAAMAGFIGWAAAVGGRGRLSAVVAGVACLGLLLVEPASKLLRPGRRSILERLPKRWLTPVLVGLVQLAIAAACTGIARPGRSPQSAAVLAAAGLVALTAFAAVGSSRSRPEPEGAPPAVEPHAEALGVGAGSAGPFS